MHSTKTMFAAVLAAGLLLAASAALAANTAPAPPSWMQVSNSSTTTLSELRVSFGKSPDDRSGAGDVVSYKVYRFSDGQPPVYVAPVPAQGSASYRRELTGLIAGKRYGIGVVAFDGTLTSKPAIVFITAFYLPPPVNLTLTDPPTDNGTTLNLRFSRSTADATGGTVTSYAIYKRTTNGPFTLVTTVPATHAATYSKTVTGLTRGVNIGLGVRASNGVNFSSYLVGSRTPQDTAAPAPPRDPVLVNPTTDDGTTMQLRFTNSVDDATGKDVTLYRLYKKTVGTEFSLAGTVSATHLKSYQYVFKGLVKGRRYCFAAAAYDGVNESTKVEVWGDSNPPGPARNLKLVDAPADNGTALKLTFDRSADDGGGATDVTQYRLFKRTTTTAAKPLATISATGAANYAYTVAGLTKNVSYGLIVKASDGFQDSTAVAAWATPKDNIPPAAPTGLTVQDWPADDGQALKITFARSSDDNGTTPKATSYGLYRAPGQSSAGAKIATITATKATSYQFKDTGLTAGQTYWYYVVAIGPIGQSLATDRVSGAPVDNRFVRPPSALAANDRPYDQGGVVDLSWAKSGDDGAGAKIVTKYYVYRKMANVQVDATKIGQVTANGAAQYQWSDTTVPLELILYEYTVRAVAANGAMSAAAGPAKAHAENNNVLVFQPPTQLTVKDITGDAGSQLLLSWRRSASEGDIGPPPPPPVTFSESKASYGGQYEFYRRTSTGTYGTLPTFSVNVAGTNDPMTRVDSGLTNGIRYYYKVRYRRYNQISDFTAEASAVPAKSVLASVKAPVEDATTALESTATGLTVSLLSPPARVPAGQNVLIGVSVSAHGRSAVCLEYAVGTALSRTAAVVGNGNYQTQLKLRTASLPTGTTVLVRAVVAGDGAVTASASSALTIVAP